MSADLRLIDVVWLVSEMHRSDAITAVRTMSLARVESRGAPADAGAAADMEGAVCAGVSDMARGPAPGLSGS